MRLRTRTAAALLLSACFAALLWAHEGHHALPTRGVAADQAKGQITLAPGSRKALQVETAEVVRRALDEHVLAPAAVEAPWGKHAYAGTRLRGKVARIHVRPSEPVRAGDALAEIDSLELEDLQLELLAAHNEARLTGQILRRVEELFAAGSAPARDVLEARTRDRERQDAVEIARRKLLGLGVAGEFLDRLLADPQPKPLRTLSVTAPISGTVLHADVGVGQVVEPSHHLFEIVDTSKVWIRVGVLEKDLHRMRPGLPVAVRLAAFPSTSDALHGSVSVVGSYLDPVTHLGAVWVDLDNPGGLLPGMVGHAEVRLPGKDGLAVPARAVVRDGSESYVLVEEGPGQYRRRNVVVERERDGWARVTAPGLFERDRVVTAGNHQLAPFLVQDVLKLTAEGERAADLLVRPARRARVAEVARVGGVVELPPGRRAVASPRLAGTVRRILVGRDQQVREGEVVAEVESLELQGMQLDALRAQLRLELVEETLRRQRELVKQGAFSAARLAETEAAEVAARQQRDSQRRRLEGLGLSSEQIRGLLESRRAVEALPVRAPLAGKVVRFPAFVGQWLRPEEALFEIHDTSEVWIRAHVPGRDLAGLRPGQPGRVRFAGAQEPVAAEVVRLGRALEGDTGALAAWARLKGSAPAGLRHGSLVSLTLTVREGDETLAVPVGALWREGGRAFVFVRAKEGRFERREVSTGAADDLHVAISAGLSAGEEIAVRGAAALGTAHVALR